MGLCGALAWVMPEAWRLPVSPFAAHAAGAALMAGGVALNLLPKRTFRRRGTTVDPRHPERSTQLVDIGLHGWSRNPMYLGHAVLLFGWSAWLAQPSALGGVALYLLWIDRLQIPAEEAALSARFGAAYADYRHRVRRWL